MKRLLALLLALAPSLALAQNAGWPPPAGAQAVLGVYNVTPPTLTDKQVGFGQLDANGNLRIAGSFSAAGTTSNASSGVATSSTNTPNVSYNYGFNGTTWDQLQVDGSKNLNVNCQVGCSGGPADRTAFTYGTTPYSPIGGVYNVSITNLTSGQGGAVALTAARSMHVLDDNSAAILTAATSAIPAGTNLIGSVSIDQTTPGTTNKVVASVASGGIASGAIASGALASGSIASGAVASGAIASGAFAAGSFSNATAADPCMFAAKTNVAISLTGTTTVKLVSLASSQKIYVCSLSLITTAATIVNIFDGTVSTTECNTAQEAVIGAGAAAGVGGLSLAANGGLTMGSGAGTVALTNTAAHDLCISQSGAGGLAGHLTYVQRVP